MRKALFPHMEWAKAHSRQPLPLELGFSGAAAPRGAAFREYGSGEPELQRRIARKYGVRRDQIYLLGGTSLANFVTIAAFCDPGELVAVETPRYAPLAEIPRSLGARVHLVSKEEGGFLGSINMAEERAGSMENAFLPRQFSNKDNVDAHYRNTGPEIWYQMGFRGVKPDAFLAGVGTGGTITGIGEALKPRKPSLKMIAVEPADSPVLSGGEPGPHKIQGIGAGFVPDVLNMDIVDEIIQATYEDAAEVARRLAREEGIFCGVSAGANTWAALQVAARDENKDKLIVSILCDTGERYLSTDLWG